jgi:peptide/nickel transport system substrate-binding protein
MRPVVRAFVVVLALAACAGPAPRADEGPTRPAEAETGSAGASRTLIGGYRFEVTDLSPKIIGSNSPVGTKRLFNADLALIDGQGNPRPYLAETLPQLNTDSWRVFPDGRMETTYRLRPGLTWHDGQPFSAEDFVFAWRVYTAPGLGMFPTAPEDQMDAVQARDARTVVIQWRAPYPDAGALVHSQLNPLPRHILEDLFARLGQDPAAAEAMARHPYWTSEYVGAGPFRLERWEPGATLEGAAFDRHALGRPKIDRLILRIIPDENTILTNVLAGNVHFTTNLGLRFEHGMVLKREWADPRQGTVFMSGNTPATIMVQFRPEFQQTPALLDVRVRRALMHTIDRQALNDGLFDGQGAMSEALVPPRMPYTAEAERAIARHPFDPQRAERLMNEAGFSRDRDGFVDARGERFRPDFRVNQGTEWERIQAILAAVWQRAGFEVQPSVLPTVQTRDAEANHRFSGIGQRVVGGGEQLWSYLTAAEIGSPADRWRGQNRTGWSDPEFERLWLLYTTTLDPPERYRHAIQMTKLVSEHLPLFMMHYQIIVTAHVGALRGPEEGTISTLGHWNVHEWELR